MIDCANPASGDFTVTCDYPCVVIYSDGTAYRRMAAAPVGDNICAFTLPNDYNADAGLIVAIRGDLNLDGKVTSTDAMQTLRIAAGLRELTDILLLILDLNDDGEITSTDAMQILRLAAGLRSASW